MSETKGHRFPEAPDTLGAAGIDLRFLLDMLKLWYSNGCASLPPESDIALNLQIFGGDGLAVGCMKGTPFPRSWPSEHLCGVAITLLCSSPADRAQTSCHIIAW
ncbi:hypothetical protein ACFQU7_02010 [Pseudoroseomonas wenyumeiae]